MRFWARSCGKGIRDYPSGGISNGSHPAETPRPNLQTSSSRDRPRVWAASTFAATLGVLLRRLQPRGSRLVPTEPLALTPHPRRAQAHPDRPKERSSLHSAPPSPPRTPGRSGGGGVATPQSRCWGAQPRCCGNGFQANWWRLAPGSGSLAHRRSPSPPSFPPVWAGGGAARCPGQGPGGDTRLRL